MGASFGLRLVLGPRGEKRRKRCLQRAHDLIELLGPSLHPLKCKSLNEGRRLGEMIFGIPISRLSSDLVTQPPQVQGQGSEHN